MTLELKFIILCYFYNLNNEWLFCCLEQLIGCIEYYVELSLIKLWTTLSIYKGVKPLFPSLFGSTIHSKKLEFSPLFSSYSIIFGAALDWFFMWVYGSGCLWWCTGLNCMAWSRLHAWYGRTVLRKHANVVHESFDWNVPNYHYYFSNVETLFPMTEHSIFSSFFFFCNLVIDTIIKLNLNWLRGFDVISQNKKQGIKLSLREEVSY